MPPTSIQIIRHAEKPPDGGGAPHGVTDAGERHEHSLSVRGWQRAGALVQLFDPSASAPRAGLARPDRIVCADYGKRTEAHRAYETVAPLGARLGTAIDHPVGLEHSGALYHRSLAGLAGAVLVCWEHGDIPALARGIPLAAGSPAPPRSWGSRFDLVWVFTAEAVGGYRFAVVPQLLLHGDGPV